jgi:hypothetical protein
VLRVPRALAVACATALAVAATPAPSPATRLHAALAGNWQGTLRYRDYQDSTRFVTLPTLLAGALAADSASVVLDFTYDDGPGKTVKDRDLFDFDAANKLVRWGSPKDDAKRSRFTVTDQAGDGRTGTPYRLVLEMDAQDDNKPAHIRETLTVSSGDLRILKEVRFAPSAPYLFRHEYRFSRPAAGR